MHVAFYAPMKPPDHPVASGDRQMARLLMAALAEAGHQVTLASRFRSWVATADRAVQEDRMAAAVREVDLLSEAWTRDPTGRPDLWTTYHNYHKAPDLLGPALTRRFGLPYVVAEASHAPKRADAWGLFYRAATAANAAADVHFCLTPRDRAGIAPVARPTATLVDLPPFVDTRAWPSAPARNGPAGPPTLVTVAMMRDGDKTTSYGFLAAALRHVTDVAWHLRVVGDGPAHDAVVAAFEGLPPDRVTFVGAVSSPDVAAELGQADLYVWPGFGEAFGLSYLEAQAMGCPVVALDIAGVSSVVRDGITGRLVPDHDPSVYAAGLRALLHDAQARRTMGSAAAAWVRRDRTVERAAAIIAPVLARLRPEAERRAV